MRDPKETARYGLSALYKAGADKGQVRLTLTEVHEMNVDAGEISLLRTTLDTRVNMTAIKDSKRGGSTSNKSDEASLEQAAQQAVAIAAASMPDDANDISEPQGHKEFSAGPQAPDLDRMHSRLIELLSAIRSRFPKAVLRQAHLEFSLTKEYLLNSNEVDLCSRKGVYRSSVLFSSKDGEKVSSFNYTTVALPDLEKPLIECGSLATLIEQSAEQTQTVPLTGKFVGDAIITPDCLGDLIHFLESSIADGPIIAGTSVFKDGLGTQIASPLLTVHSRPVSEEICDGYFITHDGYAAENVTVVDRGVLKTFLLSLYGAKKTGGKRAPNHGNAYVIDPGDTSLQNMVKTVKRGVLLARFSGGRPSDNGDFSGVAKNSYLIEDGEIKCPISESMISGNFAEMLKNIKAVSRERVQFGYALLPWVAVSGVTISGK